MRFFDSKEEVLDIFSDQDYLAFANWWKDNKYKVVQAMGEADTKYIHNRNTDVKF